VNDVYGYGSAVWARFCAPRQAGRLEGGIAAEAGTPAGDAVLRLTVQRCGPRITAARFQAHGCPVTIAVGDWLAEQLIGADVSRLSALDAAHIRQALEIGEDRAHCALMGEDVLRTLATTLTQRPT
jgi:NifU-like protein involved in Fe-S cluster formation